MCVCLCARRHLLSTLLDNRSQAAPVQSGAPHPQLFRCLRGGFQLHSLQRWWGAAKLSTCEVEATGLRSGWGTQLFLCKHLFSEAPSKPVRVWVPLHLVPKCMSSALWVSLGYAAPFCRLLLFCDSLIPFFLAAPPPPQFGKHSGSLARMTSGGLLPAHLYPRHPLKSEPWEWGSGRGTF